jgi:hypothetical protein
MAYPFAQAPTVREFADSLQQHGCTIKKLKDRLAGPRGMVDCDYIHRHADGQDLYSEPLPTDLDERLSPDMARRLMKQLRLPPDAWRWAGTPNF